MGAYTPDDESHSRCFVTSTYEFYFKNGYGASVTRGMNSYGGKEGLWELAVLKYRKEVWGYWDICYDTPITNDVIGGLDVAGVEKLLKRIEALPEAKSRKRFRVKRPRLGLNRRD